jgi:hypothetical protein
MYNISIILICFLVPAGIAVKYNAQNFITVIIAASVVVVVVCITLTITAMVLVVVEVLIFLLQLLCCNHTVLH